MQSIAIFILIIILLILLLQFDIAHDVVSYILTGFLVILSAYIVNKIANGEIIGGGGSNSDKSADDCFGVLFHGSPQPLEYIRPSPSPIVNGEEVVFGTPTRWLALVFSAHVTSKDLGFGLVDGIPYIVEMYPGAVDLLKKPGYLHIIPANGFITDKRLGLPGYEFIIRRDVPVLEVEKVPNIYEELQQRFKEVNFIPAAKQKEFYAKNDIQLRTLAP